MTVGFWRNTVGKVAGGIALPASIWFLINACAVCCSPAKGSLILRSTAASVVILCSGDHQDGRRSNTFCCGEASATCHGPVVTGHFFVKSKCLKLVQSCPSKMCFGTM